MHLFCTLLDGRISETSPPRLAITEGPEGRRDSGCASVAYDDCGFSAGFGAFSWSSLGVVVECLALRNVLPGAAVLPV